MDIRTLSYFVVVAEELNITRAAEKLHMCQPPLSSQMKALEGELNTTLFQRGKRHLTLTESGELLYRRAKEIINLTDKAQAEIISMSKGMTGIISIGVVEGMAPDIAAEWIANFLKDYEQIQFKIYDGNSDELVEMLRSGIISLALLTSPCDELLLNSFPVSSEKIVAYMSKSHPLAKKEGKIKIKDLKDEKLITPRREAFVDTIYKWFRKDKMEPNIICKADSYLDAVALAKNGAGVCIYPHTEHVPNKSIVVKEIEGRDKSIEYRFAWRKGHPLPTIEEKFIDFVKEKMGVE